MKINKEIRGAGINMPVKNDLFFFCYKLNDGVLVTEYVTNEGKSYPNGILSLLWNREKKTLQPYVIPVRSIWGVSTTAIEVTEGVKLHTPQTHYNGSKLLFSKGSDAIGAVVKTKGLRLEKIYNGTFRSAKKGDYIWKLFGLSVTDIEYKLTETTIEIEGKSFKLNELQKQFDELIARENERVNGSLSTKQISEQTSSRPDTIQHISQKQFNIQTANENKLTERPTLNQHQTNQTPPSPNTIQYIKNQGITKLYHFTDRSNIQSIIDHGGLFSWQACDNRNITINRPGGSCDSRFHDNRLKLGNYVRLSFTREHPMMYAAKTDLRIYDPVILEIDLSVAGLSSTKFSDRNAVKTGAIIKNGYEGAKNIHFSTVRQRTHFDLPEEEKEFYQAEVLVFEKVPLSYITNIDEFRPRPSITPNNSQPSTNSHNNTSTLSTISYRSLSSVNSQRNLQPSYSNSNSSNNSSSNSSDENGCMISAVIGIIIFIIILIAVNS